MTRLVHEGSSTLALQTANIFLSGREDVGIDFTNDIVK